MYLKQFYDHFPLYVETMKATDHNSPYHLEGSIWTHTCMVYSAIKALHPDNKVLLIAAILHDIGKIFTKSINNKGGHSFIGHEGVSTFLATDILPLFELTHQEKLDILHVISLHGVNISQLSNIPYLAMFRRADVIGRISSNEKTDYDPRNFLTPRRDPTHTVTLLCGLPCTRKSTYAATLGLPVLSRDNFLMQYANPDETYNECYTRIHASVEDLSEFNKAYNAHIIKLSKDQSDLVVDMTMLSLKTRRVMMSHFPKASFKCVVFLPRLSIVKACNDSRPGKFISDEIYNTMMASFVMPVREEGFTDIQYNL